jgi:alpha-tubulin suppressor-like RCC1 family protein/sugar lactone lactonase YvrE
MSNPFSIAEKVNAIIRVRRGRENERTLNIYESGEIVYSTDKKRLFVGDSDDLGATGTFGGNVAGNKIWITDNFSKLSEIVKNDLVYRTDLASTNGTGFYLLTGDNHLRIDNYILIENVKDVSIPYLLPKATSSTLGGVIVKDGLTVTNGFVQVNVDDSTIKIDPLTKKIYVPNTGGGETINTNSPATENTLGVVKVPLDGGIKVSNGEITLNVDNETIKLSSTGTGSVLYVEPTQIKIPTADFSTTGTVRIGDGLSATNTGLLSLNVASDIDFGGLTLGNGLILNSSTGKVDVNLSESIVVPFASTLSAGVVKLSAGSPLSANSEGLLDLLIDNDTIKINSTSEIPFLYVDKNKIPTNLVDVDVPDEQESTTIVTVDPITNTTNTTTIVNITNESKNTINDIVNTTTDTSISINDILNTTVKTTAESSYIKRVANIINSGGAYAAITRDNRVIAWGNLRSSIFGLSSSVLAVENVRVPFWNKYDGYLDINKYTPYGGDFLDEALIENKNYEIVDLYWSIHSGMALVKPAGELGGDVWVAGTNTNGVTGITTISNNPTSLVKTKYNNFLISNSAVSPNQSITLLNKDKDYSVVSKFSLTIPRDIIEDKTNLPDLSAESFYYLTDGTKVRRLNYGGELQSEFSPTSAVALNGLAMSINDNDKNYLYICDSSGTAATKQNKVKVVDLNTKTTTAIGSGGQGTLDGNENTAQFHTLKRIAVDPSNNNILYVTDNNRIRRLWRIITGGTTSWNVTTLSLSTGLVSSVDGTLTYGGSGINVASFKNPYGIKVSSDGKRIYVIEQGEKKIRKIDVHTNTVDSFSGTSSTYLYSTVKTAASFNNPSGLTKDNNGNIYIADKLNHRIRKISYDTSTGKYGDVITFAGNGTAGHKDAVGTSAMFNKPTGIIYVDSLSSLFVTDTGNYRIRRIDINTQSVSTLAGKGSRAYNDGTNTTCGFDDLKGITYGFRNSEHHLWVADGTRIRDIKILNTTTFALSVSSILGGYSALFGRDTIKGKDSIPIDKNTAIHPTDLVYYNDELYFSSDRDLKILKIKFSNNTLYNVAGNPEYNYAGALPSHNDGSGRTSKFRSPIGLTINNNNLYVADGSRIRLISNFTQPRDMVSVTTLAGKTTSSIINGPLATATFYKVNFLTTNPVNNDLILTDDTYIRKISSTGTVSNIDGTAKAGFADTGIKTLEWDPYGIDIESEEDNDKIYFSEINNDTIGEIQDGKVIFYNKTVAGSLGIGVGTNKPTYGFIKVDAYDDYKSSTPKFKRIQMLGDKPTSLMFAALDTEDSLWVWGYSVDGAFGTGQTNTMSPTKLYAFEKNVLDFSITASTTNISLFSIITKDNKLYVAGDNTFGQLGFNTLSSELSASAVFKLAKKDVSGTTVDVNDAKTLVRSSVIGKRNNLYINTSGDVYACGDNSIGILGRGDVVSIQPKFYKVDILSNIKQLFVGGNINYPTAFALKNDGSLYAWGYNGISKGQCLTNNSTDFNIKTPEQCYNYEKQGPVDKAIYIYGNDNPAQDQAQFGYLTPNASLFLGGYSTETNPPDFSSNIPYFRKYNMRNIAFDVNITGSDALIHRTNGTVYIINRYGPKKLF